MKIQHDHIRPPRLKALITTLLATALATPALAQRGIEWGYKDRIFEQKYVLGPLLNDMDRFAAVIALQLRLAPRFDGRPNLPAPRIMEALGGVCRLIVAMAVRPGEPTPSQRELDEAAAAQPKPPQSPPAPTAQSDEDRDCVVQLLLFETAYGDSLATDAQLSGLARDMRRRFRDVWMPEAFANDPAVLEGLRHAAAAGARVERLERAGVDIPAPLREALLEPGRGDFPGSAHNWARPERHGPLENQLTALEDAAARPLLDAKKAAEAQRAQERAAAAAQAREDEARKEAEQARDRAEAPRRNRIENLQDEIERADKDLEQEYAIARISRDRPPYARDRQASIDRIRERRAKLDAELRTLQGLGADRPMPVQVAAPPAQPAPAATAGACQLNTRCPVIELTLFCRTPQQLAAVLSQRPGRERKQVLGTLTASGDCRQVRAGETLAWTAPITLIQPQGEAAAELVPGTLADGTSGFMLRDGVLPRADAAAR
ncbi:hypothetical protein V5F44_18550 [Xanthobacter sp. V2C-8]|uniref:hypothetical protein n=1 Tax=Xanthobacter albus TaxID=3119929 RepID=UPI0037279E0D